MLSANNFNASWVQSMNQFQFRKVQAENLVADGLVKDELTPKKTTKIQDQVNLDMYTEENQRVRSEIKRSKVPFDLRRARPSPAHVSIPVHSCPFPPRFPRVFPGLQRAGG